MRTPIPGPAIMIAIALVFAACGGSGTTPSGSTASVASPIRAGTSGAAPPPSVSTGAPSPQADGTVAVAADRTQEAQTIEQLRDIAPFVLASADLPAGFKVRSAQPITRPQVIASQIGVPKLARYLTASDMAGAWASLYTQTDQTSSLSSIVFRYGSAASAGGYVDATIGLVNGDYPAATSIERVQADSIGDKAVFMRYRLPGARLLEYTWSQGRLVGDIVLRYAGDTEGPDDVGLVLSLARKQEIKMRTFAQ